LVRHPSRESQNLTHGKVTGINDQIIDQIRRLPHQTRLSRRENNEFI
jgi:hypothetical protein